MRSTEESASGKTGRARFRLALAVEGDGGRLLLVVRGRTKAREDSAVGGKRLECAQARKGTRAPVEAAAAAVMRRRRTIIRLCRGLWVGCVRRVAGWGDEGGN